MGIAVGVAGCVVLVATCCLVRACRSDERAIPRRVSGPWKVEWADVSSAAVSREIRNKDPTDLFVAMGLDTAAVEMSKSQPAG
jgi:hypothetical protein